MEEDLPWLHHTVTDALAGQEAPNGETCILDKSLDFPPRALHHKGLQTSTNQFVTGDLGKALSLGVARFKEGAPGAVLEPLGISWK